MPVSSAPIEEIRSASTELLTSESLKQLEKLMLMTFEEHQDISRQLDSAQSDKTHALRGYESWEHGFLLKRVFKQAFAERKVESDTAIAKVAELEEQLRLTTVATHVEIEKEQAEPYFQMRDDFAGLCECASIWDIKSQQAIDQFAHLAELGFDHGIISMPNVSDPDAFDVFRDQIVSEVHKIKVAGR